MDMSPNADVTFDGLREVTHTAFAHVWARPGLSLAGYTKVMLQGASVEYRPGGETSRRSMIRSTGVEFALAEDENARVREIVSKEFADELRESEKFILVDEPGRDVLLIRAGLLDVVSYVPPEPIGRGDTYLTEIGRVTLVLEIRDSVTQAIYVRAIDRDAIGDDNMMRQSNRATNTFEVKQTVKKWGSILREGMDTFDGYVLTTN
jgi:hypothetical protein